MAAIQIWLTHATGQLRLPVVPEKVTVTSGNDIKRMTLCELGEVVIPRNRTLRTLSLASYFPARYDRNCAYHNIPRPADAVKLLCGWCENGTVARLIIRGGGFNINMEVLIEEFETTMATPAGDVAWDMTLTEHRALTVKEYHGAVLKDGHIVNKVTVNKVTVGKVTVGKVTVGKVTVNPPPVPLPAEKRTVPKYNPPPPVKNPVSIKRLIQASIKLKKPRKRPGERTNMLQ